ncbi:hypothetical protein NL108_017145 [Boleophthalmus pectinirostris]|uniref:cytokine receptor family member b2 n=1 Tax=Boleophthalmus pectinirostris TaxID=150288 RepID=UPI000A1C5120|nr:cytokine receptor family member b2 [Boleophthalmus pectinirostris]XP_020782574.1 cytokine receptor family member b2 [Boleophthalmus pectinirostris]XP_020782575.1 cytokine receptor family member b2 [Boleophthalmus pectinirostris]KAJ0070643.1 hypothetical protein NL108_017145 [Boleophthalmus pectinirostris]
MFLLMLLCWLPQAVSRKSVPPAPVRVVMNSSNMRHTLQWDRDVGTAAEVTFSVSFHTDRPDRGDPCCRVVRGCEQVVEPLICDLSKAFSEPDETYNIRVTAHLGSDRSFTPLFNFSPSRDTKLHPPILRLTRCESSLCIDMEAPISDPYFIYDSFMYELKVQIDSRRPMLKRFRSLQRHVEPGITAGSQYCVSIRFADQTVPRTSDFSSPECVYIRSPFPSEHSLAALTGLLVLLLLVVLALIYTGFICLRQKALPSVLTSVRHLEESLIVFFLPPVSPLRISKQPAPSYGQTECYSSDSDSSEDESHSGDTRVDASTEPYTSKGSLCSALSARISTVPHSKEERMERSEEGRTNEAEEVNLLTLTFNRDIDVELDSVVVLSEMELPVWDVAEEQHEPEEGFGEECCESGYMTR